MSFYGLTRCFELFSVIILVPKMHLCCWSSFCDFLGPTSLLKSKSLSQLSFWPILENVSCVGLLLIIFLLLGSARSSNTNHLSQSHFVFLCLRCPPIRILFWEKNLLLLRILQESRACCDLHRTHICFCFTSLVIKLWNLHVLVWRRLIRPKATKVQSSTNWVQFVILK